MYNVSYSTSHRQAGIPIINFAHFAPLPIGVKMFFSRYDFVATVINVHFLCSQIYIYMHMFFNIGTLVGKKK